MYLGLRWGGGLDRSIDGPIDAGIAMAPPDAGSAKAKPKKRPRGTPYAKRTNSGSDFTDEETDEQSGPARVVLTASDRALEWRGENTAISRNIDMTAPGDARPLETGEINSTVSSQTGGVRACVEQGAAGTDLRATITIKMVVEGTGKVARSQLQAPRYLFEKGLLNCAQRALGQLKFPATGAPTVVTFPVNLG